MQLRLTWDVQVHEGLAQSQLPTLPDAGADRAVRGRVRGTSGLIPIQERPQIHTQ